MFFFLACSTTYSIAQAPNSNYKLTDDFINFFIGSWTGEGEFANGKKISADLTFKMSLDSSWISCEHTDKLPNRYKALSMWGVDILNGQFVAYTFDNFHGYRKFASDGWKEGKLILTTDEYYPQRGLLYDLAESKQEIFHFSEMTTLEVSAFSI